MISTSNTYYPLNVGNEWHYHRLESQPFTISITSKELIDGKTYFIKSSSKDQFSEVLREKNSVVYRRINGKEYLYLDFNRSIGSNWQELPYQRYAYIASRSETISLRDSTLVDCIKIVSESEMDISTTWYTPGIGMLACDVVAKKDVSIINGSCRLYSAIINGNSFP
jgi:hypothetical protein